MKKVISLVLALALVASFCTVAFADGSKSDVFTVGSKSEVFTVGSKSGVFDVVGGSKSEVFGVTGSKSDVINAVGVVVSESKVEAPSAEVVAAAVTDAVNAAEVNEAVDVDGLKAKDASKLVLATMGAYAAEEYPCELSFYGEGTENVFVVVLVQYTGSEDWTVAYAGLAGEFNVPVEADGTFAIYIAA